MGFFGDIKKEMKKIENKRDKKQAYGGNDYRPNKTYGSAIPAGVYDVFGVDSFDAIFEKTAPNMTKAIYDTRDRLKTNNAYYELEGKYNELQKHYNELQKQHNDLMKQQAELIELLKEKSKDVQR